ncbi:ABC transporter substrate-binding protein [Nocardioides sp.]|uniref:ABC transporter substrate-binding protein n=1 Tax=Nocardioides sp. TaxID=35761 RepID=UPI00260B6AA4|nr:ABC transporter substrate-binding protein [Nocardioides sp.]
MTAPRRWRTTTAALISALLIAPLAACGSGGSDTGTTGTGSTSKADPSSYDRNATITIGTASPSTILDPALQNNIGQNTFTFLIYDSLTQMDSDYNVKPMLATSWEFAADGSSLTLKLRDDVTFNDGTKFDASVVKANLERGKTLAGSALVATLEPITKITVVDPTTVKLDLVKGEGAELPAAFTLNAGMMVSPKAFANGGAQLATDPGTAGSGPYVPTKVTSGQEVDYTRNDNYWNKDTAYAKTMVVRTVVDQAARINGVQTGDLDVAQISGASPVQESLAKMKQGAFEGDLVTQATPVMLMLNAERGDLKKPEIRKAIALAVNREEMVDGLFSGNATAADQFYAEGFWAHNPDMKTTRSFDLEAAKKLVTDAGGASLTIAAATGSTAEPVAQALQDQLGKAGIKVTLKSVPFAQIDDMYRRGELDAQVINASPAPDPASTLTYYVTAGFDALRGHGDLLGNLPTEAADPSKTTEQRAQDYFKIWDLMAEKDVWVPIVRSKQVWVRSAKIGGITELPWLRSGFPNYRTIGKTK